MHSAVLIMEGIVIVNVLLCMHSVLLSDIAVCWIIYCEQNFPAHNDVVIIGSGV